MIFLETSNRYLSGTNQSIIEVESENEIVGDTVHAAHTVHSVHTVHSALTVHHYNISRELGEDKYEHVVILLAIMIKKRYNSLHHSLDSCLLITKLVNVARSFSRSRDFQDFANFTII